MNRDQIKRAREYWGLNIKQIATLTGIHPNTWYRYENEGLDNAEKSNLNLLKMVLRPHSMKRLMDNASEHTVNSIGKNKYENVLQQVLGETGQIDKKVNELQEQLNNEWICHLH